MNDFDDYFYKEMQSDSGNYYASKKHKYNEYNRIDYLDNEQMKRIYNYVMDEFKKGNIDLGTVAKSLKAIDSVSGNISNFDAPDSLITSLIAPSISNSWEDEIKTWDDNIPVQEELKEYVYLSFSNIAPFESIIDIVRVKEAAYEFESIASSLMLVLDRNAVVGTPSPIAIAKLYSITIDGDKLVESYDLPITKELPSDIANLLAR
jgi:hypothetical protein